MPFYVFFTLTGTHDFLIKKTKLSSRLVSLTDMPLDHSCWTEGDLKLLKIPLQNFLCLIDRKKIDHATITAAKLFTIIYYWDNILVKDFGWNYYQIGGNISVSNWCKIFWWEISVAIIIKLMTIFMWVIGG